MAAVRCPVCKAPARSHSNIHNLVHSFECVRCGSFRCDHYAIIALKRVEWSNQHVGTVSGYLRRNSGLLVNVPTVDRLNTLSTPAVGEKAARFLVELGREYPLPGQSFLSPVWAVQSALGRIKDIKQEDLFPDEFLSDPIIRSLRWLAVASAADERELHWFVYDCLMRQGWLEKGAADGDVTITPAGWHEFARVQQVNTGSRIGFVAMSFQEEFTVLYNHAIEPGISAAGYEALRVDRTEHNNRIDDEIISAIKRS
jgi:hypothetical protein